MIRKITFLSVCICYFGLNGVSGQTGGKSTYSFLDLVFPARIASLGGNAISIYDNDINLATQNPALLNPSMSGEAASTVVKYFAGIKYGTVLFAKDFKKAGTWCAGINYMDYGKFVETQDNSDPTGRNFYPSDYVVNLSWGMPLRKLLNEGSPGKYDSILSVGAAGKFIYSNYYDYVSVGVAADIGLTYYIPYAGLTTSLVFRDFGKEIKPYYKDHPEEVVPQLQLGFTKRLKLAPLRLSLILQHLEKPDLTWYDSLAAENALLSGEAITKPTSFDKITRHIIFNAEVLISKNFNIRFGYNFERRKELGIATRMSTAGFSWGFGFRVSKLHLSYGRAIFNVAGPANHFTLSMNLPKMTSRKRTYYIEQ